MISTTQPKAQKGRCFAFDVRPAVLESVTQQSQSASAYQSRASQRIIQERRNQWFETPCPEKMDAEFLASLQRALLARGFYKGKIDGTLSQSTKAAILAYQTQKGLASDKLALATARYFGLLE